MSDDLSKLEETILEIIEKGAKKTKSMRFPCIFRVPEELRKVKESAYTPQLVSIGPLHSNKEHLKSPMEDIKKKYAKDLFNRVNTTHNTTDAMLVKKCVEKMKESLDRAGDCYAEKVEVDALENLEKMKSLDTAKECSAEKVDALNVTMLVIDGCFILELLYRYHHEHKPRSNPNSKPHEKPHHTDSNSPNSNNKTSPDLCFDSAPTRVTIKHDLLLLENQLPFFVLKDLFDLTVATISDHLPTLSDYLHSYFGNMMNPSEQGGSLTVATIPNRPPSPRHYLLSYFGNMMNPSEQGGKKVEKNWEPQSCEGRVSHILHFLYIEYRHHPHKQEGRKEHCCSLFTQKDCCSLFTQKDCCSPKTDVNNYDSMPPASELEYAGVKFKTGDQDSQFKVQFKAPQGPFGCFRRASFEIPTLRIGFATETLLRNLIAFEQCYTGLDRNTGHDRLDFYFTSYATLMDRLVDTKNDVAELEKAGIIRGCLRDREKASDLFNSLCKEIVLPRDNFYFAQTCNDATSYSKCYWPEFMAQLRRTCFAKPWTFIAFSVAFIAFGVAVAQFIRNVLR